MSLLDICRDPSGTDAPYKEGNRKEKSNFPKGRDFKSFQWPVMSFPLRLGLWTKQRGFIDSHLMSMSCWGCDQASQTEGGLQQDKKPARSVLGEENPQVCHLFVSLRPLSFPLCHLCVHASMCVCMYTWAHACVRVSLWECTCECVCERGYVCIWVRMFVSVCVCVCLRCVKSESWKFCWRNVELLRHPTVYILKGYSLWSSHKSHMQILA